MSRSATCIYMYMSNKHARVACRCIFTKFWHVDKTLIHLLWNSSMFKFLFSTIWYIQDKLYNVMMKLNDVSKKKQKINKKKIKNDKLVNQDSLARSLGRGGNSFKNSHISPAIYSWISLYIWFYKKKTRIFVYMYHVILNMFWDKKKKWIWNILFTLPSLIPSLFLFHDASDSTPR